MHNNFCSGGVSTIHTLTVDHFSTLILRSDHPFKAPSVPSKKEAKYPNPLIGRIPLGCYQRLPAPAMMASTTSGLRRVEVSPN